MHESSLFCCLEINYAVFPTQVAYPRHSVHVHNRFVQGCTVACLAHRLTLELAQNDKVPDVIIIDFSVNDDSMLEDQGVPLVGD